MNKLVQKLKGVAESAAPAMGFRPASIATKSRGPLLVAVLAHPDAKSAKAAIDAGADAVLAKTSDTKVVSDVVDSGRDVPFGIDAAGAEGVDLPALKEAGCDFVVFSPATAPASWLRVEGLARVARVSPAADATSLRGLDRVGVDAVLLDKDADDDFVSVQFVMTGYYLVGALGKPVMAMLPSGATTDEVAALWDAGVDGIVAEAAPARLKDLRKAIASLPPRSRKKGGREIALLPRISAEAEPPAEEEDDGE